MRSAGYARSPTPGSETDVQQVFIVGNVNGTPTVGINGSLVVDNTILARHIAAGQVIDDLTAHNAGIAVHKR